MKLKEHRNNDEVLYAFLDAALFTGIDEAGNPLDNNYSRSDFDKESIKKAEKITEYFLSLLDVGILSVVSDQNRFKDLGMDLWFTMTGQGTGFWDGDWDELEDVLMEACKQTKKKFYVEGALSEGEEVYIY
jgi:hypothetical protein